MNKNQLREKYKKLRNKLSVAHRKQAGQEIAAYLFSMPEFIQAKTIGLYLSKGTEVQTRAILKKAYALKKIVAAPRVSKKIPPLKFFRIRKGIKDCAQGSYGILEPKSYCLPIRTRQMNLILVPGIVFDQRGYRYGYGKGYYDRFLMKFPKLFKIGLAYEKTFVPRLPKDARDIPVDAVITEKRIYRINI